MQSSVSNSQIFEYNKTLLDLMNNFQCKVFDIEIQFNFSSCIKHKQLNALCKILSKVIHSVTISYTNIPDSKQFTKLFISCAHVKSLIFNLYEAPKLDFLTPKSKVRFDIECLQFRLKYADDLLTLLKQIDEAPNLSPEIVDITVSESEVELTEEDLNIFQFKVRLCINNKI